VLVDPAKLRARGADVIATDRGGDVTFHGPGQLVAYPILDLRRRGLGAASYVRALEQCVIDTLDAFGLRGERVAGRPGVWTRPPAGGAGEMAKIAAVGVRIERGVSRHGLALNVSTDLTWFDAIVPCGIADAGVTSMARELGEAPAFAAVAGAFARAFQRVFDARLVDVVDSPLARRAGEGVPA
jgi:lipoyl(octanoyl) transferase